MVKDTWVPPNLVDNFSCGLAKVEILQGGNARLSFYTERMRPNGKMGRDVVYAVIVPVAALRDAASLIYEMLGGKEAKETIRMLGLH